MPTHKHTHKHSFSSLSHHNKHINTVTLKHDQTLALERILNHRAL
jgi:hypothetical protein